MNTDKDDLGSRGNRPSNFAAPVMKMSMRQSSFLSS
jgi:hypothetical protein